MSSFKGDREPAWSLVALGRSHASTGQKKHRNTETVHQQILQACVEQEQSTYALMRVLKTTSAGWVGKHVKGLVGSGYLSSRVVQNGGITANKFLTTGRGRQRLTEIIRSRPDNPVK